MSVARSSGVQAWFDGLDEHVRAPAEELATIIRAADSRLEHAVKWGRLTFTVGGDWHHWLCAVAATKKGARPVFHKGVLLDDPGRLLTGWGRYVREVPGELARQHADAVAALVGSAITHHTDLLD